MLRKDESEKLHSNVRLLLQPPSPMKKLLPLVIALVPLPVLAVSEELSLTADLANSSPSAFEGSLAKTLDDFFDYDFMEIGRAHV